MDYKGWTLYDEITLVIKKEKNQYRGYEFPQAYIVNPKDKKQLQTAINWGKYKEYKKDENGEYIRDAKGNIVCDEILPDIITVKNSGFGITLLDYAHNSSQGGKLSFWNCIIEHKKHNIKCIVGIASDLLLTLLIQNKFNYGKCDATVMFARKSGSIGVLTPDMIEYADALKDMQSKKDINKGKTSKWQIGCNYKTLTIDELYFGKVYSILDSNRNQDKGVHYYNSTQPYYILSKQPRVENIICYTCYIPENITKASELESYLLKTCDENFEKLLKKFDKNSRNNSLYSLIDGMRPIFYRNKYEKYTTGNKFPSRQQGDRFIEEDVPLIDVFNKVIDYTQSKALRLLSEYKVKDLRYTLESLFVRTHTFGDNLSNLSQNEKELLKYLIKYNNIDRDYRIDNKFMDEIKEKVGN